MARSTARRCSATTRDGRPCRQNPLLGSDPPLCLIHAGLTRPYQVPPERRCTATNRAGSQCGRWAERGSDPPLCHVHAGQSRLQQAPAERRCTATTREGRQCRLWAVPDSDPPRCCVHAGLTTPGPDRRCTATTRAGDPCDHPAVAGGDPPLCHFHSGRHWPPPDERRCTAQLPGGHRCPNWAARDEDPPLCATHSGRTGFQPGHRHTVTHGYYTWPPPLTETEWEAVRLALASGRALQGELVVTRLLIRMMMAYLTGSELPLNQNLNTVRLIIRNVRAVARLLLAQKEIEGPEERRERIRRELRSRDCGVSECSVWECEPEEPRGLQEEAAALLELAAVPELAAEIGLLRVLMRRLFKYTTDVGEMPLPEMARIGPVIIAGMRALADLLKADLALRPTQEEVRQAVMDQVLDELGKEWGFQL